MVAKHLFIINLQTSKRVKQSIASLSQKAYYCTKRTGTMKDLKTFYINRIAQVTSNEARFHKRAQLFSAGRLAIAFFALICLWKAVTTVSTIWINLVLVGILLFLIVVWLDAMANKKQRYFNRLKTINERENAALGGDFVTFQTGENYLDPKHPFTFDLDIFGANAVFQLVNRTCTPSGELLLAQSLTTGSFGETTIIERQMAISELSTLVDFRQSFLAIGQVMKEKPEDIKELISWLNSPMSFASRSFIRLLSFLLPTIILTIVAIVIAGYLRFSFIILFALINLAFLQFYHRLIDKIHATVSRKQLLLEKYAQLFKLISTQVFKDTHLQAMNTDSKKTTEAVQKLSVIIGFFDQRLNDLVAFFSNGFLLCDLHCIAALDKWKKNHKKELIPWLDSLFKIDELNSLANFAFNHPGYVYPTIQHSVFIEAEQLGHPLIKDRACVLNDFFSSAQEKVVILTGANMSGKSTFLRSLGVNLVLAAAGAPVFAKSFCFNSAAIYSSMRVTDSLGQDTSYFYAELKRLGEIMKNLRDGKNMVILLDEILKGTNSADKLHGSVGLVEEFLEHNCFCIVATHDLALGELERKYPGRVINYCFESEITNGELYFDYKIRRGIAQNKNASFLMRQSGLIK